MEELGQIGGMGGPFGNSGGMHEIEENSSEEDNY